MNIQEVRNIRQANRILQKDLAELIGVPGSSWANVENGKSKFHDWMQTKVEKTFVDLGIWSQTATEELISARKENTVVLKSDMFDEIASEIVHILKTKNHDYGDSFHDIYASHGDLSSYIRLSDKIGRLDTLIKGDEQVTDEPIEDVYRDIAGYAILSLVSQRRMKEESS